MLHLINFSLFSLILQKFTPPYDICYQLPAFFFADKFESSKKALKNELNVLLPLEELRFVKEIGEGNNGN